MPAGGLAAEQPELFCVRVRGASTICAAIKTDRTIKIALVGAGMFGGDVHLRAYADLQRFGIAGQLARIGLDKHARDFAPVKFELVGIATRSEASARRAAESFSRSTQHAAHAYFGETPWLDVLRDFSDLDVLAVATPDDLHTPVILAALANGVHVITE